MAVEFINRSASQTWAIGGRNYATEKLADGTLLSGLSPHDLRKRMQKEGVTGLTPEMGRDQLQDLYFAFRKAKDASIDRPIAPEGESKPQKQGAMR